MEPFNPVKSLEHTLAWTQKSGSTKFSLTQTILQGYADWIANQPIDESRYLCFIVTTMESQRHLVSFGQGRLDLQGTQLVGRGLQYFSDRMFQVPTVSAECLELHPDHALDSQNLEGVEIQIDPADARVYLRLPNFGAAALMIDLAYSRDSNLFHGFAQTPPKTLFAIALKRKVVIKNSLSH